MDQLAALDAAIAILKSAQVSLLGHSDVLFFKVNRAMKYLDTQVAELISDSE